MRFNCPLCFYGLLLLLSACGPTPEDAGRAMCDCMRENYNPKDYKPAFSKCRKRVSIKFRLYRINNYLDYCDQDGKEYMRFIETVPSETLDSARIFSSYDEFGRMTLVRNDDLDIVQRNRYQVDTP